MRFADLFNWKPGPVTDQELEDERRAIDELDFYLRQFDGVAGRCVNCERPMFGMGGTFTWGIRNGEGHCTACGWPIRMIHRPPDKTGVEHFITGLSYHRDMVETDDRTSE